MQTNRKSTRMFLGRAGAAVLALLALSACPPRQDTRQLLIDGYTWGHKDQWDMARPLVKRYLELNPSDPGAHYLWGQCHLHGQNPVLNIAEGEFLTGLRLLKQQDAVGVLSEQWGASELEMSFHREIARAYIRRIHAGVDFEYSMPALQHLLQRALRHVNAGLAVDPNFPELKDMKQALEGLQQSRPQRKGTSV